MVLQPLQQGPMPILERYRMATTTSVDIHHYKHGALDCILFKRISGNRRNIARNRQLCLVDFSCSPPPIARDQAPVPSTWLQNTVFRGDSAPPEHPGHAQGDRQTVVKFTFFFVPPGNAFVLFPHTFNPLTVVAIWAARGLKGSSRSTHPPPRIGRSN